MDGWIVRVLDRNEGADDAEPGVEATFLPAVGDKVAWDGRLGPWAQVVERRFDFDRRIVTVLVDRAAE